MTQTLVEITINGETHQIPQPMTVAGLLDQLQIDRRHVAVEHNRKLVVKPDYDAVAIAAGDSLEIVTFVGGG